MTHNFWNDEDFAEYKRQQAKIEKAYPWMEQSTINTWAASIVNQLKQL